MQKSLKSSFGQSSRSRLLALVLIGLVSLSACSQLPSFLSGGGPNVAANVQVGKTNSQTLGTTHNVAPTVSVRPNSRVDTIDQRNTTTRVSSDAVETVVVNEYPLWLILIFGLLCGFLIPSPGEIARGILSLFKRSN